MTTMDERFRQRPLEEKIEALTKERDSISACYEAREEEAHQLSERIIKLTRERDELLLQIDIQAGSIEAVQAANQRLSVNHKDCVKCLGEALQDRADLAAAAKLAVEKHHGIGAKP